MDQSPHIPYKKEEEQEDPTVQRLEEKEEENGVPMEQQLEA
jgi:hypothetical protein